MISSDHRRGLRKIAAAFTVVMLAVAVSACGSSSDSSGSTAGETGETPDSGGGDSGGGKISIGYASPVASNPNQQDIAYGMEQGAKSLAWDYSVIDSNLSPDKQVTGLETFVTQKKSGIVAWALDPNAVAGAFQQATQSQIPIVGLNSAGPDIATDVVWSVYTCGAGSPPAETASYIAKRTPSAKVLVIGPPPVPPLVEETECFEAEAKKAGLQVVDRVDNVEDTSATAAPMVADMITKHGELDAIWAYNDTSALGASTSVLSAGGQVWSGDDQTGTIIFGSNADVDAIEAIGDGRLTATWDTNAAATGWAAIKALSTPLADGEPVEQMPAEIVLESKLWDGGNVAKFVPQQERKYTMDNLPIKSEK